MRGSRHRLLSGLAGVNDGLGPRVTAHGVVGELFQVLRSRIRRPCPGIMFGVAIHCECFERIKDPSVQFPPMFFQKAAVGDFLGQRMLEGINGVARAVTLIEQLGGLKLREMRIESGFR